jgi:predicted dehydrogenase
MMRLGVVGCGYWGSKHVRVLHSVPEVEQVIGIDPRRERLRELKRDFPALKTFEQLDEALNDVDAIIVATPPETHARVGMAAMQAGKSVLIEKPLATSTIDARQLVDMADRLGLVLGVGHTFEYNAAVWKLRDLVDSGDLGNVHYIDSARLNLGLYQADVNVIWDLAPHDVSICNYVLGSKPSRVEAWGCRHAHSFLEDVANIRLTYDDPNVTANIRVSWLDPCKVRRTTVVGSTKMAVYNDMSPDERIRVYDKGVVAADPPALASMPMTYRVGDIQSPYLRFEEPLLVQDREFASCVARGERPPTDGANGLAVVEVLEAAQISLRAGRAVHLLETELRVPWETELARMTA